MVGTALIAALVCEERRKGECVCVWMSVGV